MNVKANQIAFEKFYPDGSGVEYAVRLKGESVWGPSVELEHINNIHFPLEMIDWIIACLKRIQDEADTPNAVKEQG